MSQTPSSSRHTTPDSAAISRIDHILIDQREPDGAFQLFANQLQLPVAWPMTHYGEFSSGGICFGNVVLELGRFAAQADAVPVHARLAGIAFRPTRSTAESMAMLEKQGIAHGPAEPFTTKYEGKLLTLWTNLPITGIGPADARLFLCEYHFDVQTDQAANSNALKKLAGGPLGLIGVREIVIETRDMETARASWRKLLSSAEEAEPGLFDMSSGPVIRLVSGKSESLRSLTIEVASLAKAKSALVEHAIAHDATEREILLGTANGDGLPFRIVQRD